MLSTDKIPNSPITGPELQKYSRALLINELKSKSVPDAITCRIAEDFTLASNNDWFFKPGTAYPLITLSLSVRLHYLDQESANPSFAYELIPVFKYQSNTFPDHVVVTRSIVSNPPLQGFTGKNRVVAFTLKSQVKNPNLIRIHFNMPITRTERIDPKPGELFGQFRDVAEAVDPTQYDKPEPPEVSDESSEYAAKWGVRLESEVVAPVEESLPTQIGATAGGGEKDGIPPAAQPKRRGRPRKGASDEMQKVSS